MLENRYQSQPGVAAHHNNLPKHIAIIMDGNGRWAKEQKLSRTKGHQAGVKRAQEVVSACGEKGISVLTLFAFGVENWKRPASEVRNLFRLFLLSLSRDIHEANENNVRLQILGDKTALSSGMVTAIAKAEQLTQNNTGLLLNIMLNYSGRWDLVNAIRKIAHDVQGGSLDPEKIQERHIEENLILNGLPEPDLLIRTGGVQRISNFFLWELAYTELYFTPAWWPDFGREALEAALQDFAGRERRYGLTSQQVVSSNQFAFRQGGK